MTEVQITVTVIRHNYIGITLTLCRSLFLFLCSSFYSFPSLPWRAPSRFHPSMCLATHVAIDCVVRIHFVISVTFTYFAYPRICFSLELQNWPTVNTSHARGIVPWHVEPTKKSEQHKIKNHKNDYRTLNPQSKFRGCPRGGVGLLASPLEPS